MENSIGKKFVEQTRYPYLEPSLQSRGEPLPPLQTPLSSDAEIFSLPAGRDLALPPVNLINLVGRRETLRKYSSAPLSLNELAYLLWGTQGVKSVSDRQVSKRTTPSAGARHAFETYVLVNRVEGLAPGLYRYLALEHQLAKIEGPENIDEILTQACLKQPQVKNSAITLFWVAVPLRMVWRYSQRGYRYLYLDAGHVCQNLYLLAEAIDSGVCAIAAFDDALVNQALGLDGEEQFAIYAASLGKR